MRESWSIQLVYAGGVVLNRHGYETEADAIREAHRIMDCQTRRPPVVFHRIGRRPEDAGLGAGGGFYNTSYNQLQAILWHRRAIHFDQPETTPAEPASAEPAPAEPAPAARAPADPAPAEPARAEPEPDDDDDDGPPLPS